MRAYYLDHDTGSNPRLPHERSPPAPLTEAELNKFGILYWDCSGPDGQAKLESVAKERGYRNRDEVRIAPGLLPDYEKKIKMFFDEHIHEDEEIRFALEGSGYFDVRSQSDDWVRIRMEKGDLIVLPAGIYHRFTTDTRDYIHVVRLFTDAPKWEAINRPLADSTAARAAYLQHTNAV
ncbi:1,2-dihydroxy-3-keto-5-methylthiopentene dioxygenase [Tieghemiomyces parasiticus]|uniref:Acireductone dioxygenase n=1 Tax=Tieghemiomyces parasiticus TaxID=78921 RepID=A0A9W7ZY73_9FUNG|nr:1,2-dihydroxy-3-keto-5-methylthiopentene dioxygenase [Tieghemiomyces parasiticus]